MKFTRQFDQMDCGPACIRMVASAYGKDYPLQSIHIAVKISEKLASHKINAYFCTPQEVCK